SIPFAASSTVQVKLIQPANCAPNPSPADAEVMIQYAATQGAVSTLCGTGSAACSGICTATDSDPSNCGSCGTACGAVAHGSSMCQNSACTISFCNVGFGDCDGIAADGCETSLTSTANCGACGHSCNNPANAALSACSSGQCSIAACNAGFGDCDGSPANGCETNITTDDNNCGACAHVCGSGTHCHSGVCS